jgi:hypothetical protein
MSKAKVIKSVNDRLSKVGHGIEFSILTDGVRADGEWWYVPVLSKRGKKQLDRQLAVNIFANVENDLQRNQKLTVLIVPVVD